MGCKPIYSPILHEELCNIATTGATNRDAAALAGISEATIYNWLSDPQYQQFRDDYTRSKAQGRKRSVDIIANSEDWRAHAWLLERVDPEHWGKAETDPSQMIAKLSAYMQGVEDAKTDADRT